MKDSESRSSLADLCRDRMLCLDGFVEQQMAQTGIVGLAAAIILDRKLVWLQGYGFALPSPDSAEHARAFLRAQAFGTHMLSGSRHGALRAIDNSVIVAE